MRADARELVAVAAGGFVGAIARAALIEAFPPAAGGWPWATFVANVVGAFVLGWVTVRLPRRTYHRPLLGTGFCGALTTFSTMQVELLQMLDRGRFGLALAYAGVSVVAGLLAVALATDLGRRGRLA